jgi:hypothetical protein
MLAWMHEELNWKGIQLKITQFWHPGRNVRTATFGNQCGTMASESVM